MVNLSDIEQRIFGIPIKTPFQHFETIFGFGALSGLPILDARIVVFRLHKSIQLFYNHCYLN